jgi:hypothetical protein
MSHSGQMDPEQVPDIYTDAISVTAGNFGFTLTLMRSEPPDVSAENPGQIVGRIRMSTELAEKLAELLATAAETNIKAIEKARGRGNGAKRSQPTK